jgi:dihydrolipoamide dehydrogenase
VAETKEFDLTVIGAGPGGYVAAIKAAQEGIKVALIEKKDLGGVCLNVGCIPTKTLLAANDVLKKIQHAKDFGINVNEISFDFSKMKMRKDNVVGGIRKSLEGLIKSNKIEIIRGEAKFDSPHEIKVFGENNLLVKSKKTIIATGSTPIDVKSFPCDGKKIHNSTTILDLETLPKSLAIIGGGYIGCEFASLYASLGCKVTILEALDSIVSLQGKTISDALTKAFVSQGIEIQTNVFVQKIDTGNNGVVVELAGGKKLSYDMALVSIGRKLNTGNLNLEKIGVALDQKGAIAVNEKMETSVPDIYAIGDVTGKWLLAHVASHQGMVAAQNVLGKESKMHYYAVPAVIFTTPEIAMVGMTLEQAIEEGYAATVGKFPFQALGKSVATNETEGFAQIISDKKTGQLLGAQIIGSEASALIGEMTLAVQNELTLDCVIDTIHAHPTVAEAWLEAALIANETPIHFPPKKK